MNPDDATHLDDGVPMKAWTPPDPIGRHRWEYLAVQQTRSTYAIDITMELNAWGAQGWELVAIDRGCFIFKRPAR